MRTKHLCVLNKIRTKGEVGTIKHVKLSSDVFADSYKAVLLLWILFSFFVLHVCLCYAVLSVPCSLV